jgi:hypothetical protein
MAELLQMLFVRVTERYSCAGWMRHQFSQWKYLRLTKRGCDRMELSERSSP